jgi:hypothetical protein
MMRLRLPYTMRWPLPLLPPQAIPKNNPFVLEPPLVETFNG